MGYIVGRNSGTLTADVAATPAPDSKPPLVEPPAKIAETAPAPPAPTETAPQQPAKEAEPEPAPTPAPAKPEKVKSEPAHSAASHPSAGQTYLQLAATSKHEADIMVDVLRKKSFKAMAAEIDEKPGTYRVLVGPITDTTANKMRADLQGAACPATPPFAGPFSEPRPVASVGAFTGPSSSRLQPHMASAHSPGAHLDRVRPRALLETPLVLRMGGGNSVLVRRLPLDRIRDGSPRRHGPRRRLGNVHPLRTLQRSAPSRLRHASRIPDAALVCHPRHRRIMDRHRAAPTASSASRGSI